MYNSAQTEYWRDDRHFDYHRRQFAEPYRSTVALCDLMERRMPAFAVSGNALDVGCGSGANMLHIGRRFPSLAWTGVDIVADLFPIGEKLLREHGMPGSPRFLRGDAYRLGDFLPEQSFDVVFSLQTLSWMPGYEPLLAPLLAMVKPGGYVVISSLFTDALVDAKIELTQHADTSFKTADREIFYNVYCLERFCSVAKGLGVTSICVEDFAIDCDLPKPTHRHMGTYTEKLVDGRRLQVSGPLLMPWKFVILQLDGA